MAFSPPRGYNRPPSPAPRVLGDATQPLLPRNQEPSEPSSPPTRKNITTSMTNFINRLRPSKRPEKGSTARVTTTTNQPGENRRPGETRTASGSILQQRVNSISRHNPDAIPSSLWRTPISLPRRAHSIRERNNQETMPGTPHLIPRKKVTSPGRGENRGLRLDADNRAPFFQRMGEDEEAPLLPHHPSQAVTIQPRHTRDAFTVKQELRRQRRNLKESGDFLGVTGINPYTGQMDVITPTTSSEEASTSYSIATVSHLATLAHAAIEAVDGYENVQNEASIKRQQGKAEESRKEVRSIIEQHGGNVVWQRKDSAWSSVATPKLSPIPQSQRSLSLHNMDSEDTLQRSPVNRSPNRSPFLGHPAVATRMEYHRPATEREEIAIPAILSQELGKFTPSSNKENVEQPLGKSSSLRPRTVRFNLPPLITRRSGHGLQDRLAFGGDQLEPRHPVVSAAKGHRYRHSLPDIKGLGRISDSSVLQLDNLNPADQWASRLMQDLGCSGAGDQSNSNTTRVSVRTASSTTEEQDNNGQSAYTPITITTGSECSQNHPPSMNGCGETTEDFEDTLLTPTSMSTTATVFSPQLSCLSLAEMPSSIFSEPPASPTEMQLSIWPSIESRTLEITTEISDQEMVLPRTLCALVTRTPPPFLPKPEQDSVITSSVAVQEITTATTVNEEKDVTECSQHVSTESPQSPPPAQWSMRKTMREGADNKEEEEVCEPSPTKTQSSPQISTSTSHDHHHHQPPPPPLPLSLRPREPSMGLDHAIARGAARAAFTHLVTTIARQESPKEQSSVVIPIKEPNDGTSIPRQPQLRTVPAPVSDRESIRGAGPEERRDLASLVMVTLAGSSRLSLLRNCLETMCKWVRVVLSVIFILVSAYWELIRPVFDGDSELRKRLAGEDGKEEVEWEDWGICLIALVFMFGVVVVAVWMIRGFVWVSWVVCQVGKGMWRILGV
ncbi:hypothetical protein QBC43DRAFT_299761 [Cladorrhinum sp. PSN259]|nr:hypothetical protein QBC43DRAFT_299761 [Cladorrhinum sp. PSN259]